MLAVGVTGGIGSGKSLVCDVFRSLHVPVYQADAQARRIMEEDPAVREELAGYFGRKAYSDGLLNRPYIAARIFTDEKDREFVNSIVHPAVHENFMEWVKQYRDHPYVIEEAALLFESGAHRKLDMTLLVTAPVKLRMERIRKRNGLKRAEITARMSSQIKPGEAEKLADHIIINDDETFVLPQVLTIHQKIMTGS